MIVKTRVFDLCNNGYKNLSELAHATGISVSNGTLSQTLNLPNFTIITPTHRYIEGKKLV